MLSLSNLEAWSKLSTPYGTAEKIPQIIESLQKEPSTEIIDEICWEKIYCQGTLYQVTFASIPYLIDFVEKAQDRNLAIDVLINVGIILSGLDEENHYIDTLFDNEATEIDKEASCYIVKFFWQYFDKFKPLLHSFIGEAIEVNKHYYLVALASADKRFHIAKVFATYTDNVEYTCCCPECKVDVFLENENNDTDLVLYIDDPVLNDDAKSYKIIPFSSANTTLPAGLKSDYEWLRDNINILDINCLKQVLDYLFGEVKCPKCNTPFNVFDAILKY